MTVLIFRFKHQIYESCTKIPFWKDMYCNTYIRLHIPSSMIGCAFEVLILTQFFSLSLFSTYNCVPDYGVALIISLVNYIFLKSFQLQLLMKNKILCLSISFFNLRRKLWYKQRVFNTRYVFVFFDMNDHVSSFYMPTNLFSAKIWPALAFIYFDSDVARFQVNSYSVLCVIWLNKGHICAS